MRQLSILLVACCTFQAVQSQNLTKNTIRFAYTRLPIFPLPADVTTFNYDLDLQNHHPHDDQDKTKEQLDRALRFWTLRKAENEGLSIKVLFNKFEWSSSTLVSEQTREQNGEKVRVPLWSAAMKYRYPLHYEVRLPNGDLWLSYTAGEEFSGYNTEWTTQKAGVGTLVDNEFTGGNMGIKRRELMEKQIAQMGNDIRSNFDYSQANHGIHIYTVKKYKRYNYTDLDRAYAIAQEAFALYKKEDRSMPMACRGKLGDAISIWEKAASEFNSSAKSRINTKIAAKIYQNLYICYTLMHEFDKADNLRVKTESSVKQKAIDDVWLADFEDRKKRVEASAK